MSALEFSLMLSSRDRKLASPGRPDFSSDKIVALLEDCAILRVATWQASLRERIRQRPTR